MNYTLNYICKEMKLSIFMSLHFSSYMHFFMMLLEESITNMKIMVFIVVYRNIHFLLQKVFCILVTLLSSCFLWSMSYLKEVSEKRIFFQFPNYIGKCLKKYCFCNFYFPMRQWIDSSIKGKSKLCINFYNKCKYERVELTGLVHKLCCWVNMR